MIVSRGLVGPKTNLKLVGQKGNRLIFLYFPGVKLTFSANTGSLVWLFKLIAPWRTVTVRRGVICDDESSATRGTREKGPGNPYQDPTQVPLV